MKLQKALLCALCVMLFHATGCNESGVYGAGHDFGDNNPEVYLCFGDSLTQGFGGVTPWPAHLEGFLGKTVINRGLAAERVDAGLRRLGGVLDATKPGYCLILHGMNDVIHSADPDYIAAQIRSMIHVVKSRNVLPAVGTITYFVGSREVFNGSIDLVNERIRAMAAEEKVLLVDCGNVIKGRRDYVLSDGLHFSEAGSIAIAAAWSDRL